MANVERKKKHHIIPRLYLDGFCDQQGMVWAYHNDSSQKPPHCKKPENTAFIKNFYALHLNDGSIDTNIFEDALADIIESPAAGALRGLKAGQVPSHEDRQRLSLLFGFMLVRTASYRAHYEQQHEREFNIRLKLIANDEKRFQDWANEYQEIYNESLADDIKKLRQEILNDVYVMQLHPNQSLKIMHILGSETSMALATMKWIIIKAPERLFFLTSDNPIFITNPAHTGFYSPGLMMPDTRVFIPVSKDIGILMVRSDENKLDNSFVTNDKNIVIQMNQMTIAMANQFVYASEKAAWVIELINNVKKNFRTMK